MASLGQRLYRLQVLDQELREQLSRLREKESLLGETQELRDVRSAHEEAENNLGTRRSTVKDLEFELQQTVDKLKAAEARLYGGEVSNPKELHGLQQDQEYLLRSRSRLEDQLLQAMAGAEASEAELAVRSALLREVRSRWETAQAETTQQVEMLRSKVAELKSQRSPLMSGLDSASKSLYEDLCHKKGGRAVVLLVGQTCQGCRVSLPTGKVQEVRRAQAVATCPNCGRILIVE